MIITIQMRVQKHAEDVYAIRRELCLSAFWATVTNVHKVGNVRRDYVSWVNVQTRV